MAKVIDRILFRPPNFSQVKTKMAIELLFLDFIAAYTAVKKVALKKINFTFILHPCKIFLWPTPSVYIHWFMHVRAQV